MTNLLLLSSRGRGSQGTRCLCAVDTERLHGVQDFTHQTQGRWIAYVFCLGKGVRRPMIRTSVTDGGWKEGVCYRN